MPRPGLEPGTSASSAQRSPRLSYLGTTRANADIVYVTFASALTIWLTIEKGFDYSWNSNISPLLFLCKKNSPRLKIERFMFINNFCSFAVGGLWSDIGAVD